MSDNFTETHFYHCICVSFVVHNITGELTLLTPGNVHPGCSQCSAGVDKGVHTALGIMCTSSCCNTTFE